MSYTIPENVDTREQAVLAVASAIKGEAVTGGDGSVNRALDILADVLAEQDVQVPQTNAGAILALAQYVGGGGSQPTGTINISTNGTHDVAAYATAEVGVYPTGTKTITSNGKHNVMSFQWAQVNVQPTSPLLASIDITLNDSTHSGEGISISWGDVFKSATISGSSASFTNVPFSLADIIIRVGDNPDQPYESSIISATCEMSGDASLSPDGVAISGDCTIAVSISVI